MKRKNYLGLMVAVMMVLVSLATSVSADFTETFDNVTVDELSPAWTLPNEESVETGIGSGVDALVLRRGTEVLLSELYATYSYPIVNGSPYYIDLDFSYSQGGTFQIRHLGDASWRCCYNIVDGYLQYSPEPFSWENLCEIEPDVKHTLRSVIYSFTNTMDIWLDGVLVGQGVQRPDMWSTNTFQIFLTGANTTVNIYRFARIMEDPANNFVQTFQDQTLESLEESGWKFEDLSSYSDSSIEVEKIVESTGSPIGSYLYLDRTKPGGEAQITYTPEESQSVPFQLSIDFLYWGQGVQSIVAEDEAGAEIAGIKLENGVMYTSSSGKKVTEYVEPYTVHNLSFKLSNGAALVYLDDAYIFMEETTAEALGKLRFINSAAASSDGALYGGLSLLKISAGDFTGDSGIVNINFAFKDADGQGINYICPVNNPTAVTGEASVINITTAEVSGRMVMAKYVNGVLKEIKLGEPFAVGAGEKANLEKLTMTQDTIEEGTSFKLFAFKGLESMEPIGESASVGAPEQLSTMIADSIVDQNNWNLYRIAKAMKKAKDGNPVVIGALGGSITEGAGASVESNRYADRVCDWWEEKFPGQITRKIAGVGGTDSYLGVHRMNEQLMQYNPDFVVIDFAVNDNGLVFQDYAYEEILRNVLGAENEPGALMVFFTNENYINAQVKEIPLGNYYSVPMVSPRNAIAKQYEAGNMTASEILADIVHPNDLGHWLASKYITSVLDEVYNNLDTYLAGSYTLPESRMFQPEKYADGQIFVSTNLEPETNEGWTPGYEIRYVPSWSSNFDGGWSATEIGSKITFEVEGKYISLLYERSNLPEMGRIKVTIDGSQEKALYIDSHFDNPYGGIALVSTEDLIEKTLPELEPGVHTVEIELVEPTAEKKAQGVVGNLFGLCGIMVSK